MNNREKLRDLLLDVFLLEPGEFHFGLQRDEVPTWDSLGVVSMAIGIRETFGYHCTPQEASAIRGVPDLMDLLRARGVEFDD